MSYHLDVEMNRRQAEELLEKLDSKPDPKTMLLAMIVFQLQDLSDYLKQLDNTITFK